MSQPASSSVAVLTWNVWWRFGPDWRRRQPLIVRHLREAEADVVALQGCWRTEATSQAHEFAEQLGLHATFAGPALPPPPAPPGSADQVGVEVGLGLLSRWEFDEVEAVPLPSRHRDPAPVALRAVLRHPAGPLHVAAACLEWEPAHQDDRAAQAEAVAALATHPRTRGPLPVILCGDLNAAPDSPVLDPVRDVLVDAWSAGGGDPVAPTLPREHPQAPVEATELLDQRIDHVFVGPGNSDVRVEVRRVAMVGDPVDGLYPSDHRGVLCQLSWQPIA